MREFGYNKETNALHFLETQGFQLIARNFYCRQGEIDLIGIIEQCLIFVEVRFRKNHGFGTAQESVTTNKQKKIIHCAEYFLIRSPQYANYSCRFDVVAITLKYGDLKIDWIPDAFRRS